MMVITVLVTAVSFCTFILEDPKYYDVPPNEIGGVIGTIGMYSEFFVIACDIVTGPIIDIFGRKKPVVIGFFIASSFLFLIP